MKRISWVDTAKALGIFLVVLGHHDIDPAIRGWIYSFHVPLFFFISGYLFDRSGYPVFSSFCVKKIRTVIVPYFFFAIVSDLFWLVVVRQLCYRGENLILTPLRLLIGIFYGIGTNTWAVPLDPTLWFLPCLFITEMLFWQINHCIRKAHLIFVLIGLGGAGYFISALRLPRFPWGIEVALVASVFYGAGFLCKDIINRWMTERCFISSIGVFFALSLWISHLNGRVDMNNNHYANGFLFYASAFSGILFLIGISKAIRPSRVLGYVGRNTLIVLGLSGVAFFLLQIMGFLATGSLPDISRVSTLMGIVFSLLQILILVPVIHLFDRYLPYFIGRKMRAGK